MRTIFLVSILILSFSCSVSKQTGAINPFQGERVGCGNFIVYKLSEDGSQYISISVNANEVEFKDSYALVEAESIEVRWRKFDGNISSFICSDISGDKPGLQINQIAKSGSISIKVSDEELKKKEKEEAYKVTLILKDIIFDGLTIDYLHLENIQVGWLPG